MPLRRGYSCVSSMYVSFVHVHPRVLVDVMSTLMIYSLPVDLMMSQRIGGELEHGVGISAANSELSTVFKAQGTEIVSCRTLQCF